MIIVKTNVVAPIEKVWDYWTNPEHIVNWNNASDDWHCPKATNELKIGGKFNYTMASKDGAMSFDFYGEYTEVKYFSFIAYTMGDGRKAKLLFEETNEGTSITESFDPENVNSEELQRFGWQSILNNFKKYTENKV